MSGDRSGEDALRGLAAGLDLGGTSARAALVDVASGRVLVEKRAAVLDHAPEAVADLVRALVEAVDPRRERRCVGVGFAGMLRGDTGVVENAPNYGWRGVDLRGLLRARLGPSVTLQNDVDAIAWGERCFGAGRGARDLLCVYVGTGIGGGLVVGDRLYTGAAHLAGEIGHVKVVPGGRACGCGQRGCIEAYASGRKLAERAREELADGGSAAVELAGGLAQLHAGHLDAAARAGDRYATSLWDEIARLLGLALANAVTLMNPSVLVLGGGVWEGAPELRRRTVEQFHHLVNAPSGATVRLVDAALGDAAGVIGAAALALARSLLE